MSGPHAKRARAELATQVEKIVGTRGVSRSALERVVQTLIGDKQGVRVAKLTQEAHVSRLRRVRCEIKMPSHEHGEVSWEFCSPNQTLALLVSESPELQRWFAEALQEKLCSRAHPW